MRFLLFPILLLLINCSQRDSAIEANHKLYIPKGNGPFPVVIAIPGCSGVSLNGPDTDIGRLGDEGDRLFRRHYSLMAQRLQDEGFIVFLIDYLSAEGVPNTCNGEIHPKIVGKYIKESISFVKMNPASDPTRINIMGWSHGGSGVLEWLYRLEEVPVGVRSAIAVYPGCSTSDTWDTSLPLLMILGEEDDIALPTICNELILSLPDQTNVQVLSYPDARHGFDFTEGPSVLSVGNGLTVGRNSIAGNEAWKEILIFLNQN
jgi:dienelactone hydrolase